MAEVGSGPASLWSSSPPFSSRSLRASCPELCLGGFGLSEHRDSTTSLDSLCQCSDTLTVKRCFLMFRQSCVSVCAFCILGCHWALLWQSWLCTFPPGVSLCWWGLSLSLLFSRPSSHKSLNLSLWERCFKCFKITVTLCWTLSSTPCLSCPGEPRSGHGAQVQFLFYLSLTIHTSLLGFYVNAAAALKIGLRRENN